ncbi:MAG: iron-sulfur cluster assembly scaffold protein [Pseudomonadota bacterium]
MTASAPLATPTAQARKRSPLCGSTVTVEISIGSDGRIDGYSQNVKACALGQAAASVAGRHMIGRSLDEVVQARDELRSMLKNDGPAPSAPFEELEVLLPAKDFRNRHASILLALDATVDALETATCPQREHS